MIFEGNVGLCPNCGNHSAFNLQHRSQVWPEQQAIGNYFGGQGEVVAAPNPRAELRVPGCLHCRRTVTLLDTIDDTKVSREMIYPEAPPRQLHDSVPEDVRSVYAEASRCEQVGAMRAAGVLYRAAVEALAGSLGAEGRTLYDQIEALRDRLPADVVDNLHEARLLGNDSIHDLLAFAADEVEDVAELIEEAVLHVYVQPQQRAAMRARRATRREGGAPT